MFGFSIFRSGGSFSTHLNLPPIAPLLHQHFHPTSVLELKMTERQFPFRMRADLQRAIDRTFGEQFQIQHFSGIRTEHGYDEPGLMNCVLEAEHNTAYSVPPEYEELDIGESQPLQVLKNALWLLEAEGLPFAVMLSSCGDHCGKTGLQFQVGAPNSEQAATVVQQFYTLLEDSVAKAESYRGKILSLEQAQHSYSGQSSGITVHQLRDVKRDQVILPADTLDLLERNVVEFARNRRQLLDYGMSMRKGLLFYGPPGTGKTHTIHHLAKSLPGHTTLLIAAEQVGLLSEYMTLARLLQPSVVVIEDVDLIARDRTGMGACEELMLNKLLNEMDGLKQDAEVFFLLTTNRPEALESALASRPGRIDQAIEFPLPDADGRRKLVQLYAPARLLNEELIEEVVRRTDGVSAAFIKELMRRATQFFVERNSSEQLEAPDLDVALDEMLFKGGLLNRKLLGASADA